MADLGAKLLPLAQGLLEPGEELRGALVASQQTSFFKGRQAAVAVTDRRLVVQGMNRRFEPDGEPTSLPPERIAAASADGAGEGWFTVSAAVMDGAAVVLKIRTTDGQKLKLHLMRGTGALAKLGGGEVQRQGVEALAAWLAAAGG
jgi:hypothetical protein